MRRLHDHPPVYDVVRSNFAWPDHILRLMVTAGAVAWCEPNTVLDPACGDASIVEHAHKLRPIRQAYLNDISKAQIANMSWGHDFGFEAGLSTLDAADFLEHAETCDVVILTEILEHVEDPAGLLKLARQKARYLVASSPLDEIDKSNIEHLWAWSKDEYRDMLVAASWEPVAYIPISFTFYPYIFQLWICR